MNSQGVFASRREKILTFLSATFGEKLHLSIFSQFSVVRMQVPRTYNKPRDASSDLNSKQGQVLLCRRRIYTFT